MACFPKLRMAAGIVCCLVLLFLACPLQAQPSGTTHSTTHSLAHLKPWNQQSPVEKIQLICVLSYLLAFFTAEIMFIVAGFRTSVGWGLFMIFFGGGRSLFAALVVIVSIIAWTKVTHQDKPHLILGLILLACAGTGVIIFIIRHWEEARRPLAVTFLSVILALITLTLNSAK